MGRETKTLIIKGRRKMRREKKISFTQDWIVS